MPFSHRRPLCSGLALVVVLATLTGACGGGSANGQTATPSAPPSSASSPSSTSPSPPTGSASRASGVPTAKPVPVESNPPGDIPDNLAFVPYTNKAGRYTFTHPEGWARTGVGTRVRFTDKLNGVAAFGAPASGPATVSSAKSTDVPRLRGSVPAFELRKIEQVTLPGGKGVRIVFRRNSEPDQVTGKVYRDEVEEYLVYASGHQVTMDLYGPVGADNVDAYRTMSQSLRLR